MNEVRHTWIHHRSVTIVLLPLNQGLLDHINMIQYNSSVGAWITGEIRNFEIKTVIDLEKVQAQITYPYTWWKLCCTLWSLKGRRRSDTFFWAFASSLRQKNTCTGITQAQLKTRRNSKTKKLTQEVPNNWKPDPRTGRKIQPGLSSLIHPPIRGSQHHTESDQSGRWDKAIADNTGQHLVRWFYLDSLKGELQWGVVKVDWERSIKSSKGINEQGVSIRSGCKRRSCHNCVHILWPNSLLVDWGLHAWLKNMNSHLSWGSKRVQTLQQEGWRGALYAPQSDNSNAAAAEWSLIQKEASSCFSNWHLKALYSIPSFQTQWRHSPHHKLSHHHQRSSVGVLLYCFISPWWRTENQSRVPLLDDDR